MLERLRRQAQAVVRAECALRLRKLVLAPPCRPPKNIEDDRRAEEGGGGKKKKKKKKRAGDEEAWEPPRRREDFYPRQARVVGA